MLVLLIPLEHAMPPLRTAFGQTYGCYLPQAAQRPDMSAQPATARYPFCLGPGAGDNVFWVLISHLRDDDHQLRLRLLGASQ
jgi:hypothetical protein